MVTAGFKCAPLTLPAMKTPMKTAKPQANVINNQGFCPSPIVFFNLTLATTPCPKRRRKVVQKDYLRPDGYYLFLRS